jgi:hypothetical protein
VGAGLDSFWPPDVPTDVGLFLMVRIVGPQDEFEDEHRLEIRLVTPDREEHEVLQAGFRAPPGARSPFAVPGIEPGILVPAGIAFRAEDYGFYTLEIYLDGQRLRSIPVNIRPASELTDAGSASGIGGPPNE